MSQKINRRGFIFSIPLVSAGLFACNEAVTQRELSSQVKASDTSFDKLTRTTEQLEEEVLKWNSHSDEEKYFLNAVVLHQVTQEICKNIKGDKFIRADVQVLETGYKVSLIFEGKFCSFRLPLFTDMLTKERASELILSTIQSSRFSCSENISTQSP